LKNRVSHFGFARTRQNRKTVKAIAVSGVDVDVFRRVNGFVESVFAKKIVPDKNERNDRGNLGYACPQKYTRSIVMKSIMMKKCFIAGLFLLSASLSFAQMKGNVELYSGALLFDETSGMNGPKTVYKSTSVSAGVSGGVYFNDTIGLKAYLDFLIPLSFKTTPNGEAEIMKNDYDFLLGMDEFFGVVFNVVKTERLTVPVMVGLHGKLFFSTIDDYFTTAANSGIGLGIGAKYALKKNWYILSRVSGAFDFLGFSIKTPTGNNSTENEQTGFDMALIRTWGIAQHFGIGFRF
jgi:hypothetical protein